MASLTTANSAPRTNGVQRITWQEKLQGPRRPRKWKSRGRTAWSSTVTIQGRCFAARYFYDGQNTNNAKEDAAEVALTALRSQGGNPTTSFAGQLYAQNSVANQPARRN
ncbi:conserved hypothetical protein [Histoplasma capsulatum var. duboisii H88]|uniref:DRBM domain-containing protein n=1 Tax=Ajellomyces capsulatus (strain H88) TaxID=544711 RepID=F0U9T8_AJEC8|nr:conserved hypothetical protein [Histoplasma capsulatum var. duboisii H88]